MVIRRILARPSPEIQSTSTYFLDAFLLLAGQNFWSSNHQQTATNVNITLQRKSNICSALYSLSFWMGPLSISQLLTLDPVTKHCGMNVSSERNSKTNHMRLWLCIQGNRRKSQSSLLNQENQEANWIWPSPKQISKRIRWFNHIEWWLKIPSHSSHTGKSFLVASSIILPPTLFKSLILEVWSCLTNQNLKRKPLHQFLLDPRQSPWTWHECHHIVGWKWSKYRIECEINPNFLMIP